MSRHLVLAAAAGHAWCCAAGACTPSPCRVDKPGESLGTTLYSGMVPGLIAGLYSRDEVTIDLRRLAAEAGVAFVEAEIQGPISPVKQSCLGTTVFYFTQLSWM